MTKVIILKTIYQFFNIVNILILGRILLSWIRLAPGNPLANFLYQVTEPILSPCRLLLNKLGLKFNMIDFSPLLAVILLQAIERLLIYLVMTIF